MPTPSSSHHQARLTALSVPAYHSGCVGLLPLTGVEMVAIDRKAHWESVYSTKGETGVSWYQSEPRLSLELIRAVAPSARGRMIDVGGRASMLVDRLLGLPFEK